MNYQTYGGQPPKVKKPNSGFVVPNDRKRTANDPDMSGTFTIGEDVVQYIMQGGRDFWVSGWNKQATNPKTGVRGPLMSLSLKPKVARASGGQGGYGAPQQPAPQQPQGAWNPALQTAAGTWQPSATPQQQHFSAGTPGMYPPPAQQPQQWPGAVGGPQQQPPQGQRNNFPNDDIPF